MAKHSTTFDHAMTQKLLRLLGSLRRSESGSVVFRQVEDMLGELTARHTESEHDYLDVITMLLSGYAAQLPEGSSLQIELRLLQSRFKPPVTTSDLDALRSYLDLYSDQFISLGDLDTGKVQDAIRPIVQNRVEPQIPPTDPEEVRYEAAVQSEMPAGEDADIEEQLTAASDDTPASYQQSFAPSFVVDPEPAEKTLESVPSEWETNDHIPEARGNEDEDAQDSAVSDNDGIAQQVLEAISKNQEFGVLLELVENELRHIDKADDVENLRWTMIRQVEKLSREHGNLASKLDGTHQYLKTIETDSRQLSDELSRVRLLSLTDELTGLHNRRAFLRRLEDEVARVQRYGFPLSMALIDLDKFKQVNDEYGHAGGDEVLRIYSKNILSVFRHHDLVARYGGEEFAVLLANTSSDGASRALHKVRNRAAETRWESNGVSFPVPTFSAGLAFYKPGETTSAFIERVDQALYRAKRLGRNRIELDDTYPEEPVVTPVRNEKSGPGTDA